MILPPSIIEVKILVDKPDDYGCYMYRFVDTKHELQSFYLGIKKDKLSNDGGQFYWGSSENEEFNKLVQGSEPRFILEIIDFRKTEDFNYLQLKEYTMLQEYQNIKTNPATYNLSYGIPPIGKNNLPTKEYIDWFNYMKKTDWKCEKKESVKYLLGLKTFQIRDKDSASHIKDIKGELQKVGGNSDKMNHVLIFEGIGEKFGFDRGSDVVAGSRHGLMGAKSAGTLEMGVIRVPKEVLEDKSEYFIRSLAGNDNHKGRLNYSTTFKDIAKLLVSLNENTEISPDSEIAKEQIEIVYGKVGGKAISRGVERAKTDIKMGKLNKKWKRWSDNELKQKVAEHTTEKKLSMYMSSGMYDERKIIKEFRKDYQLSIEKKKRKEPYVHKLEMDVIIHHGEESHETKWNLESSTHLKNLNWLFKEKGYKVTWKPLYTEIDDTVNDYNEDGYGDEDEST